MQKEKVLVTGGAGFIGSHLVDALLDNGYQVIIIDNLISGKKEYLNPQAKFYEIDICSSKIPEIFGEEKPDYVFHLAAQVDVRKSVDDPIFDNKVNAQGSLNIFQSSVKNKVKKVIFASTGGALYGDVEKPAKENDPVNPISPYAIHKYAGERYLAFLKEVYGLDYLVLRLANIYGPRQYKGGECGVVGIFTSNAVRQKQSFVFGNGAKTRDYLYVDDVVRGFLKSIEKREVSGVFNLGTKKEISVLDIIKNIEDIQGKIDYSFAKDKPGEVKRSILDFTKAQKILDWEPKIDFSKGLKKTLEWVKNRDF